MYAATPLGILPPMIVYKAKEVWRNWVIGGPKHSRYAATPTGWFTELLVEVRARAGCLGISFNKYSEL